MSDIGPGDWVECIKLGDVGGFSPERTEGGDVVVGGVYCVRAIVRGHNPDGTLGWGLRFVGIRAFGPRGEGAWRVELFRPIYRPKACIVTALRAPIPARNEPAVRERV